MRAVPTALPVVTHLFAFLALYAWEHTVEVFTTQLKPVVRFMDVFVNRILTSTAAAATLLIAVLSCSDSSGPDRFNTDSLSVDASRLVASIDVHLASSSIKAGETTQATVILKDRRDKPINAPVQWSSSDTTIATVSDSGLVRGVAPGSVNVLARNKTVTGTAPLTVTASDSTIIPVASVTVALASSTLNPGQTTQATARTLDANGNVLTGRAIAWSTNNTAVATVSSAGVVTAVASGSALIVATSEGKSGNSPLTVQSTPPPPPPGGTLLFEEDFENTNIASRGWYDNTSVQLSTTEHIAGSISSAQYRFLAGARTPTSGGSQRHKFTPSNSFYLSYYVKYSTNWVGSGQAYHPHEFYALSSLDGDYDGPSENYLDVYVEQNYQNGGRPRLAVQDNKSVNYSYGALPNNLVGVTENRSVGGCNGIVETNMFSECFNFGTYWYNDIQITGPVVFQPNPGAGYKNNWNFVEAYFQLNTIVNGIGQADGVMQYWFNGALIIDRHDVLFRTGAHPTLQFTQFLIAPYIGDGSPVDQSMWVDNLRVATARIP
jgi:Bacterial Ig-like domain (group 2)